MKQNQKDPRVGEVKGEERGKAEQVSRKVLVSPSILSADFANLARDIAVLTQAGADWLHIDVMDGHFVPNLTIGPPVVAALRKVTELPLDVHLMIETPEKWIDEFAKAGSAGITIHIESTKDPVSVLQRIRELGCRPGITLRPGTAWETLLPCLPWVDLVLVMTVEPGFGGQSFMHDQLVKLGHLRNAIQRSGREVLIEVDGGITDVTAALAFDADVFVAGSYIFRGSPKDRIPQLRDAVLKARSNLRGDSL